MTFLWSLEKALRSLRRALKSHKRALSLLEMLLCISLLSLAFGSIGFKVHKTLKEEKFEKSVSHILEKILFARDLSLNFGVDITLDLKQEKEGLSCIMTPHTPLINEEKWLSAKNKVFKEVEKLSFNGLERSSLKINITNSGHIEPIGTLQLSMQEKNAKIILTSTPKMAKRS